MQKHLRYWEIQKAQSEFQIEVHWDPKFLQSRPALPGLPPLTSELPPGEKYGTQDDHPATSNQQRKRVLTGPSAKRMRDHRRLAKWKMPLRALLDIRNLPPKSSCAISLHSEMPEHPISGNYPEPVLPFLIKGLLHQTVEKDM